MRLASRILARLLLIWAAVQTIHLYRAAEAPTGFFSNWTPSSFPVFINGVAFGNNVYCAVGDGQVLLGQQSIFTSADATHWVRQPSPGKANFLSISFKDGLFVAAGPDGVTGVSPNGLDWSFHTNLTRAYTRIIATDQEFLVTTRDGSIGVSANGLDWSFSTVAGSMIRSAAKGKGTYVLALNGALLYSRDKTQWHAFSVPDLNFADLTFGNGRFAAAATRSSGTGEIWYSDDGETWQNAYRLNGDLLQTIAYGNGLFLAGGSRVASNLLLSTDGIAWQAASASFPTTSLSFGGGRFFSGSYDAVSASPEVTTLHATSDQVQIFGPAGKTIELLWSERLGASPTVLQTLRLDSNTVTIPTPAIGFLKARAF